MNERKKKREERRDEHTEEDGSRINSNRSAADSHAAASDRQNNDNDNADTRTQQTPSPTVPLESSLPPPSTPPLPIPVFHRSAYLPLSKSAAVGGRTRLHTDVNSHATGTGANVNILPRTPTPRDERIEPLNLRHSPAAAAASPADRPDDQPGSTLPHINTNKKHANPTHPNGELAYTPLRLTMPLSADSPPLTGRGGLNSPLARAIHRSVHHHPHYARLQPYPPIPPASSRTGPTATATSPYDSPRHSMRAAAKSNTDRSHKAHSTNRKYYLTTLPPASFSSLSEAGFAASQLSSASDPIARHIDFRHRFSARHVTPAVIDYAADTQRECDSKSARAWSTVMKQDEYGCPTAHFSSPQGQRWQAIRSPNEYYQLQRSQLLRPNSKFNHRLSADVKHRTAQLTYHTRLLDRHFEEEKKAHKERMKRRYAGEDLEAEEQAAINMTDEKESLQSLSSASTCVVPFSPSRSASCLSFSSASDCPPLTVPPPPPNFAVGWCAWEARHDQHIERHRERQKKRDDDQHTKRGESHEKQYDTIKREVHIPPVRHQTNGTQPTPVHPYTSHKAAPHSSVSNSAVPLSFPLVFASSSGAASSVASDLIRAYHDLCTTFADIRLGESTPPDIDPNITRAIQTFVQATFASPQAASPVPRALASLSAADVRRLMIESRSGEKFTLARLQELALLRTSESMPQPIESLDQLIGATRTLHFEFDQQLIDQFEARIVRLLRKLSYAQLVHHFKAADGDEKIRFDYLCRLRAVDAAGHTHRSRPHPPHAGAAGRPPSQSHRVAHTAAPHDSDSQPGVCVLIHGRDAGGRIVGYAGVATTSETTQSTEANQPKQRWRPNMNKQQKEQANEETSIQAMDESTPFDNDRDAQIASLYQFLSDWPHHSLIELDSSPAPSLSPSRRPASSLRLSASSSCVPSFPSGSAAPGDFSISHSASAATLKEIAPPPRQEETPHQHQQHHHQPQYDQPNHQAVAAHVRPKFLVTASDARTLFDVLPRGGSVRLFLESTSDSIRSDPTGGITPFATFDELIEFTRSALVSNSDLDRSLEYILNFLNSPQPSMLLIPDSTPSGRALLTNADLLSFFSRLRLPLVHASIRFLLVSFQSFAAAHKRFHSIEAIISEIEKDKETKPDAIAHFLNQSECVLLKQRAAVGSIGSTRVDHGWDGIEVRRLLSAPRHTECDCGGPHTLARIQRMNDSALRRIAASCVDAGQSVGDGIGVIGDGAGGAGEGEDRRFRPDQRQLNEFTAELCAMQAADQANEQKMSETIFARLTSMQVPLYHAADWLHSLRSWIDPDEHSLYHNRPLPTSLLLFYLDTFSPSTLASIDSSHRLLSSVIAAHRHHQAAIADIHKIINQYAHQLFETYDQTGQPPEAAAIIRPPCTIDEFQRVLTDLGDSSIRLRSVLTVESIESLIACDSSPQLYSLQHLFTRLLVSDAIAAAASHISSMATGDSTGRLFDFTQQARLEFINAEHITMPRYKHTHTIKPPPDHKPGETAPKLAASTDSGPPHVSSLIAFHQELSDSREVASAVSARLRTLTRVDAYLTTGGGGESPSLTRRATLQLLIADRMNQSGAALTHSHTPHTNAATQTDTHAHADNNTTRPRQHSADHRCCADSDLHRSVTFQLALLGRLAAWILNEHRVAHRLFADRPTPLDLIILPAARDDVSHACFVAELLLGLCEFGPHGALAVCDQMDRWIDNSTAATQRIAAQTIKANGTIDRRARDAKQLANNIRSVFESSFDLHSECVSVILERGLPSSSPQSPVTDSIHYLHYPLLPASLFGTPAIARATLRSLVRVAIFDSDRHDLTRHAHRMHAIPMLVARMQERHIRDMTHHDADDSMHQTSLPAAASHARYSTFDEFVSGIAMELDKEQLFRFISESPIRNQAHIDHTLDHTPGHDTNPSSPLVTRDEIDRLYHSIDRQLNGGRSNSFATVATPKWFFIFGFDYLLSVSVLSSDLADFVAIVVEFLVRVASSVRALMRWLQQQPIQSIGEESNHADRNKSNERTLADTIAEVEQEATKSITASKESQTTTLTMEEIHQRRQQILIDVLYRLMSQSGAGIFLARHLSSLVSCHGADVVASWSFSDLSSAVAAAHTRLTADRHRTWKWICGHTAIARHILPHKRTGEDEDEDDSRINLFQLDELYHHSEFTGEVSMVELLNGMLHHFASSKLRVDPTAPLPLPSSLAHAAVDPPDECLSPSLARSIADLATQVRSFQSAVSSARQRIEACIRDRTDRNHHDDGVGADDDHHHHHHHHHRHRHRQPSESHTARPDEDEPIRNAATKIAIITTPTNGEQPTDETIEEMIEECSTVTRAAEPSGAQPTNELVQLVHQCLLRYDRDQLWAFLTRHTAIHYSGTRADASHLVGSMNFTGVDRPAHFLHRHLHSHLSSLSLGQPEAARDFDLNAFIDRLRHEQHTIAHRTEQIIAMIIAPNWLPVMPKRHNEEDQDIQQIEAEINKHRDNEENELQETAIEWLAPSVYPHLIPFESPTYSRRFLCALTRFVRLLGSPLCMSLPSACVHPHPHPHSDSCSCIVSSSLVDSADRMALAHAMLLERYLVEWNRPFTEWKQIREELARLHTQIEAKKETLAREITTPPCRDASGDPGESPCAPLCASGVAWYDLISVSGFRWDAASISSLFSLCGSILTSPDRVDSMRFHMRCCSIEARQFTSIQHMAEEINGIIKREQLAQAMKTSQLMRQILTPAAATGDEETDLTLSGDSSGGVGAGVPCVALTLSDVDAILARIRQLVHIAIFTCAIAIDEQHRTTPNQIEPQQRAPIVSPATPHPELDLTVTHPPTASPNSRTAGSDTHVDARQTPRQHAEGTNYTSTKLDAARSATSLRLQQITYEHESDSDSGCGVSTCLALGDSAAIDATSMHVRDSKPTDRENQRQSDSDSDSERASALASHSASACPLRLHLRLASLTRLDRCLASPFDCAMILLDHLIHIERQCELTQRDSKPICIRATDEAANPTRTPHRATCESTGGDTHTHAHPAMVSRPMHDGRSLAGPVDRSPLTPRLTMTCAEPVIETRACDPQPHLTLTVSPSPLRSWAEFDFAFGPMSLIRTRHWQIESPIATGGTT